jgi:hypothetical protein
MKYVEFSANTIAFISYRCRLTKVLAGAARGKKEVRVEEAESSLYFIFSPGSLRSSDVYRCESGRCCTLLFFLMFFIISAFQVFLLY